MKYLKQFGIILTVSFLGEVLHHFIPLPIPASIYGIILMFAALALHVIPLDAVREVSGFLVEIMPVMFIPAAAGLLESWGLLRPNWVAYVVIMVVTTFLVMLAAGHVTQAVLRRSGRKED